MKKSSKWLIMLVHRFLKKDLDKILKNWWKKNYLVGMSLEQTYSQLKYLKVDLKQLKID